MSLKDLFNNQNLKSVTSASLQDVIDESESLGYLESYIKEQDKFRPALDFSLADNFVRFGSAEKYYIDSIERIYKTYPYDGSRKEKVEYFLSSSDLDNYIFENEYPRTNGYANFIKSAATSGEQGSFYYPPTSDEFILVKGGPNTSQRSKNSEINDTSGDYKDGYANTYDFAKNRENNLKIGGIDGNTVEFWLKKDSYVGDQEYFEFILDANVTGSEIGDETFGRFSVALVTTGTAGNSSNQAFSFLIGSGSTLISTYIGSSNVTTGTIADGQWHHYALRYKTVDTNTVVDLFVDGEYDDTTTVASTINYVSGNVVATVGALSDPIKASSSAPATGSRGWAPFSGSLDEFRYWKVWRDSQEIGRQYIEPIGAGTNTDDANTHLGIYFKFNEGITQTASIDSTVLDYSGRISNGAWTGYDSVYSRSTGSALVESGRAPFEFKDPILYSFHPAVVSLLSSKRKEGQEYDYRNPNSIYKSIPSWITEQDYGSENSALENLTQILSSYFDTLHAQIENLSSLKHPSYISGTMEEDVKPYFFNDRILESYGFPYIPDLFKDASFIEYFRNRDDQTLYEEKLYNIKNIIYNNIYNNLSYINKSKGTEKAFRNFFRCFGLDDELLKIRFYSNNGKYEYLDNTRSINKNKKYVNFSLEDTVESTVYQYKTGDNTTSFISGSDDTATGIESTGHGFTLECQTIFPIIPLQSDYNKLISNKNYNSGALINSLILDKETSIYGLRTAGEIENDLTIPINDRAGFTVKSIRQNKFDQRCKFKLEPTNNSYFPTMESSYFEDVFDDTKWNFAVSVRPTNYGQANFISGSEDVDTYDVVFMGTRIILGENLDSFEVTSTISNNFGKTILTKPKRAFIGAERENLSGSLITRAFSNITDCRYWLKPLSFAEIKKHNSDVENYGIDNPYDSAYLFQDDTTKVRVSNIETLALNWNFNNLTSSNTSGRFNVDDFSSGSVDDDRYGDLSGILSRQHSGRGDYFIASSAKSFVNKNVYNTRTDLPGYINSSDMINITKFDDATYTRETRPISYFMTIEKSMYQTISEEMINIFSTMVDYGSLVGKQYSKYRVENKDLKHLRQLFFENISNTPKLEKYIDYYRWFDTSLSILISNLVPLSAMRTENDTIIKPIVEEHIFNKEKYLSQFPTIEFKTQDPEGTIRSINELLYPWKEGHAPIQPSPSGVQATATITTTGNPSNNETFTLTDAAGQAVGFVFKTGVSTVDGSKDGDNVIIGVNGCAGSAAATGDRMRAAITASDVAMTVVETGDGAMTLTQDGIGSSGNTVIDMSGVTTVTATNFVGGVDAGASANKNQKDNCLWWKERAKRTLPTTGDADADSDRQQILDVINNLNDIKPPTLSGSAGAYQGSTYALRKLSKPLKLNVDNTPAIRGGANSHENKKVGFWDSIRKRPTQSTPGEGALISIEPPGSKLEQFKDCDDNLELNRGKRKYNFSVATVNDGGDDLSNVFKGDLIFPFSIYSSSVTNNPAMSDLVDFQANLAVTNLHHDNYGFSAGVPMQGPFTEKYVGGRPYRHVMSNFTIDNEEPDEEGERLEGWRLTASVEGNLDLTNVAPHNPKSVYFREEYAKRPVNIKNIKQLTGAIETQDQGTDANGVTRIGNYSEVYEIMMTNARSINNKYLIKSEGNLASVTADSTAVSGVIDFALPRRDLTGSNKHVIVNRFSAPGEPATMGEGMLDVAASELSIYNALPFRNLSVRQPLQELLADHSNQFGLFSDARTIADYNFYNQLHSPQKSYPGGGSGVGTPANAIAILEVIDAGGIGDGETFRLVNTAGVETIYRFNAGVAHGSQPGGAAGGTVQLGFGGAGGGAAGKINIAAAIVASIGATTNAGFTAVSDGVSKVTVTQTIKGVEGEKNNTDAVTGLTVGNFTGGQTTTVDYDGTGSFHKVNRNGRKQPRYSNIYTGDAGTIEIDTANDNFFIQHQIPQTDLQYAWITASVTSSYSGSALYGYQQPNYSNNSYASTDLVFPQTSFVGSADCDGTGLSFGYYTGSDSFTGLGNSSTVCGGGATFTSGLIKTSFVGLNINVREPVTSSKNHLGFPDGTPVIDSTVTNIQYFNRDFIENGTVGYGPTALFNALILHRQGPYGGANWKLYRKDNHPIVRTHRKENRLSYLKITPANDPFKESTVDVTKKHVQSIFEPPLTSKYKETNFFVNIINARNLNNFTPTQKMIFNQSYLNNFARFSTNIPNESPFDINKSSYFKSISGYDNLLLSYNTIKDLINGEVTARTNPISTVDKILVNEVFWPKQEYTYLSTHRQRENYINYFWRNDSTERRNELHPYGGSGPFRASAVSPAQKPYDFILQDSYYAGLMGNRMQPSGLTASIWSLDAREDFETNSPGRIKSGSDEALIIDGTGDAAKRYRPIVSGSDGSGILQNSFYPYSNYIFLSSSLSEDEYVSITGFLFPQYNRRIAGTIASDANHEYKFGDTKFEASTQSGLSPFYDTYAEYCEDIKRTGKDHSIIPEFRISEHMDFYLSSDDGFKDIPTNVFELTGAGVSSTEDIDFYKTYMHSDFMEMFNVVTDDFNGRLEAKNITITADALIKFLPYDGFYPADRTVQLAQLFHDSFKDSFAATGAFGSSTGGELDFDPTLDKGLAGYMNPIWKSLFAPGILYNSIKSGLAVDYPVHTVNSPHARTTGEPNQRTTNSFLKNIPRINSAFDYRVPFEALVIPDSAEGFIGRQIVDNEPHPSASLNLTSSLTVGKSQYSLAMSNFLASTIDFFLPGGPDTPDSNIGNMTTIISDLDNTAFSFEEGKEYKMRIVCSNGTLNSKKNVDNNFVGKPSSAKKASYNVVKKSVVQYAQTGSDTSARSDYYGSAFGLPCDNNGSNLSSTDTDDPNYGSASFEPFTPPYYDGYSHIELTLSASKIAEAGFELDASNLLDVLERDYYRQTTGVGTTGVSKVSAMNLSASINIGIVEEPTPVFSPEGVPIQIDTADPSFRIVIQPKWECPILDFADVDVTLPNIGSGSVARGMWHQYGSIPDDGKGVYLQVQDIDDSEKANPDLTGSLIQKLNFDTTAKKLGRIAPTKTISEAIVAIPFTMSAGQRVFPKIEKELITNAILLSENQSISAIPSTTPSQEIIDMVSNMKKFVIPPHLDFVTDQTIQPFPMFILPFTVDLKTSDLANIWQNLTPKIGRTAEKIKATLPVNVFKPETDTNVPQPESMSMFSDGFDKNTRWMVFKVKQRSSFNYFDKTQLSADDGKFKKLFKFGGTEGVDQIPNYSYNWPYDFFSLIELGKLTAQHTFKDVPIGPGSNTDPTTSEPILSPEAFDADPNNTIAEINLEKFTVPGEDPTQAASSLPGIGEDGSVDPIDPGNPAGPGDPLP